MASTLIIDHIESIISRDSNKILATTDTSTGDIQFAHGMPIIDEHHVGHVAQFKQEIIYGTTDIQSTSDIEIPVGVCFTKFRNLNILPGNHVLITVSFVFKVKASSISTRSMGTVYLNRTTGTSSAMEPFNEKNILTKVFYNATDTNTGVYRIQPVTLQYLDTTPPELPMYALYVVNRLDYDQAQIQRSDTSTVEAIAEIKATQGIIFTFQEIQL